MLFLGEYSDAVSDEESKKEELVPWGNKRPKTRADCLNKPRPCPWVGCKYHILLDVNDSGQIVYNVGKTPSGRARKTWHRVTGASGAGKEGGDAPLMKALEDALRHGTHTCVLDAVEGGRNHTLEETGTLLNVTRERIRQIEVSSVRKMRIRAKRSDISEGS